MSATVGGKEFYTALQEKAMAAVKATFKSVLYPIQYPAQGDFMYNWQNGNQVFNDSTYQYINANVAPGDYDSTAAIAAGGTFPNNYVQVLNAIVFTLNKADSQALKDAQSNASTQAQSIISDYQGTFGTITPKQMEDAKVTTKQDYVIS